MQLAKCGNIFCSNYDNIRGKLIWYCPINISSVIALEIAFEHFQSLTSVLLNVVRKDANSTKILAKQWLHAIKCTRHYPLQHNAGKFYL